MESPCRTVFAIPELLELIAQFLATPDQLNLSSTNRFFHQTVAPVVWSTLSLVNNAQARRLKYSADALRLLKTHIHRVREVKVQAKALIFMVNSMIRRPHNHPYDQTTTTTYSAHSTISGTASEPTSPFSPDPSVLPQMSRLASMDYNTDDLAKGGQCFLKVECSEYKAMPRLAWFL
ncbi:hypothetical protein BGX30_008144 [Mortierella sp. GBA39]|nr:hypothetical protein BGX30_008144 [Mortierella sp. GBA39]